MLVSRRRFAKIIGKSHTWVNQKVDDGTIALYGGKVKVEEAKQALLANQDPTRDAQREANAKRKKIDKGVLPLDREPEYKTVADMTEDERQEYDARLKKEQEEVQRLQQEAKEKGIETQKEKIPGNLNQVKLFKEFYLGKIAQLNFNVESGKYVKKEQVEKEAFEAGRKTRDAVMNVPDRISSVIATLDDEIQIRELLTEELIYALGSVAGESK